MIHEANEASGGQSSRVEIGSFLRAGAEGPEHQALLRLIAPLLTHLLPFTRTERAAMRERRMNDFWNVACPRLGSHLCGR